MRWWSGKGGVNGASTITNSPPHHLTTQKMLSVQLHTVRTEMASDPMGTLERLAEMGYAGVEGSGFGNSDEFLQKLHDLGLKLTGGHVGFDTLRSQTQAVIDHNRTIGNRFVIVPWIDESWRGDVRLWQKLGEELNEMGMRFREAGITLCYHHHDFEFSERHGENGKERAAFDTLMQSADTANLKAELDTYWVQKGGEDPVEVINRYAARLPLLHLKDMAPDGSFAAVGTGILDWNAIFAAADSAGVEVFAVEQDVCPGPPLDALQTSIQNLRAMGRS